MVDCRYLKPWKAKGETKAPHSPFPLSTFLMAYFFLTLVLQLIVNIHLGQHQQTFSIKGHFVSILCFFTHVSVAQVLNSAVA